MQALFIKVTIQMRQEPMESERSAKRQLGLDPSDKAECFFEGIKFAKEGNHLFEISSAIGRYAEERGYGVVRDLCGHGIGTKLHEAPEIPNLRYEPKGNETSKRNDFSDRTDDQHRRLCRQLAGR